MATDRSDDVNAFREFIGQQIALGGAHLTPRDCLDLWLLEHAGDAEREAAIRAVREALDDMHAGDVGMPASEFLAEIRRKYGLEQRQ